MPDRLLALGRSAVARRVVGVVGVSLPPTLARDTGPWTTQPLADRPTLVLQAAGGALAEPLARALAEAGAAPAVVGPFAPFEAAGVAWSRPARWLGPAPGGPGVAGSPPGDERALSPASGAEEPDPVAIVADLTGLATVADLAALHGLFQPRVRDFARNARVLLLTRPPGDPAPRTRARPAGATPVAAPDAPVAGAAPDGNPAARADAPAGDSAPAAASAAAPAPGSTPAAAPSPETAATRRAVEGFTRSLAKELGRRGSTANLLLVPEGAEAGLASALRWFLSPRSAYVTGQVLTLCAPIGAAAPWVRPLDTQVALVTGGAQGIGAATARALAREGAKVVVLDRPEELERAEALAAELGGVALGVDLGAAEGPAAVAAAVRERFGGLDVLVQNAGVTRDKMLANMDEARWALTLRVNTEAVLALHAALLPLFRPGAREVCLSSIAGLAGNVGQTNYAASKAAVAGFVEAAAPALGARGLRINAVAPGFIETRMTAAIPFATREAARRLCNLSQGGLPEDVAEAVLWLASPGAAGVNGQVLRVCGGNLIGR